MAESPDWKTRLQEARARAVFEPTPTGARPYTTTVEAMAERLDAVEVVSAVGGMSEPARVIASAVALLLREQINTRMYAENMRSRMDCGPDRLDEIAAKLDALLTGKPYAPGATGG